MGLSDLTHELVDKAGQKLGRQNDQRQNLENETIGESALPDRFGSDNPAYGAGYSHNVSSRDGYKGYDHTNSYGGGGRENYTDDDVRGGNQGGPQGATFGDSEEIQNSYRKDRSGGLSEGQGGIPGDFGARGGVRSRGIDDPDSVSSGGYGTNNQGDSYSRGNQSGFDNEAYDYSGQY
ncbi:hypothetical protein O181_027510 [Austropuccinia psidii MF-1]|uniref:Uncharacterized protein n=1 Tax=Austropuccinia psidii MF-1 TaxID=1389203 RepID=A0A9Q3H3A4_9BASI|nr:hypothetical protein [Austropuccinia psidii MF-1]